MSQTLLETALQCHKAGQLSEAIAAYQALLHQQPDHGEALHLLGVALHQTKQYIPAVTTLRQALAQQPDRPDILYNLGLVLQEQGELEAAADCYQQALMLHPTAAQTHNNLGNVRRAQGKLKQAVTHYQAAIDQQPDYAKAYYNLGITLLELHHIPQAAACFHRALMHQPDYPDAQERLRLLLGDRDWSALLLNDTPDGHYNLGLLLHHQGNLAGAIACFRRAIQLKPDYAEAYKALAVPHVEQQKLSVAITCYQRAIDLRPDYAEAHADLGWVLLLAGQWQMGWLEYEWRLQTAEWQERSLSLPRWQGDPLAGKTILLHAEQGLGDTIQFVRYAEAVAALGGRVILLCAATLAPLLQTVSGISQVVTRWQDAAEIADVHCSLLSLPFLLGSSIDSVPAQVPYLTPPEPSFPLLHPPSPAYRIGIVWASGYFNHAGAYESYRAKCCPIDHLLSLLHFPDVCLYSLQVGRDAAAIADYQGNSDRLIDLSPHLTDFAATATAIQHLDLIISVDTAVAHLAGALAKPTWVLLPYNPDWRWLLDRSDSPWYPTLRLFRQPRPGDWEFVIQLIIQALADQFTSSTSSSSPSQSSLSPKSPSR